VTNAAEQHLTPYHGFPPVYHGGYAYGIERIENTIDELLPLHAKHWEETERAYFDEDLNVDYARYVMMEQESKLVMFTCRATDCSMAGNIIFSLGPHANSKHNLLASEVALFVHPDHRGRAVLRLLDYAEDCLLALGVHYITIGDKSPCGGASLDKLLGRRGFKPFAITHIKKLER
jgi:GNAT superfamily N-acetyltransferase